MTKIDYTGKTIKSKNKTYFPIMKIGSGSFASVWMSFCKEKNALYAIKIFHPEESKCAKKEITNYEFFDERKIRHTIKMHETISNSCECIVFDLMVGSLYSLIKNGSIFNKTERNFKNGFPINTVIKITKSVLESLVDLHKNKIIHGDIKPENILLSGKTKFHDEIVRKLSNKTSNKKIIDAITNLNKKKISSDSSDSSDSSNSSSSDSDKSSSNGSALSYDPKPINLSESDGELINSISPDVSSDASSDVPSNNNSFSENNQDSQSDNNQDSRSDDNEDTQSDNNQDVQSDNISEEIRKKSIEIDGKYIEEPKVKLADMGSCVMMTDENKHKYVQTKYYRSPEIILGIGYDYTCDIWALGCSIYELLTGKLLFNPDKEDEIDQRRCMLIQMYAKLGKIPEKIINKSPMKQVFYTNNCILKESKRYIKKYMDDCNVWYDLIKKIDYLCQDQQDYKERAYEIIDLIFRMLSYDPEDRISASDALKHKIFS